MIPHKSFISSCFNFKLSKPNIDIKKEKKINNTILKAVNLAFNKKYRLNEFDINKIDRKFFIESERLLPKNNYVGFSITQGNIYRKKEWPLNNFVKISNKITQGNIYRKKEWSLNNFVKLSSKIVQANKTPVFFIENKNKELRNKIKELITNALFAEHETNLNSHAFV